MSLLLEMWDGATFPDDEGDVKFWRRIARLEPDQHPGSLSNNAAGHREILHFTTQETESVISRSIAGVDQETAAGGRVVDTVGLEEIVTLRAGDTYELLVHTDRMTEAQLCRFRHP